MQVVLHLEAACLAQLACTSRTEHERLGEPVLRWCANQRRAELAHGLVRGDLLMANTAEDATDVQWTLERLHLAEHPPRFPRLYFNFASDELVGGSRQRVEIVVAILQRFPGLCMRIEGFGNPSAPPALGRAVAQARAAVTRQMLLRFLQLDPGPRITTSQATNPWTHEVPELGVYKFGGYDESRGHANVEFYLPQLIGDRIQAVGRWGADPELRNSNFTEIDTDDWDNEAKFRRVDFTITGLRM